MNGTASLCQISRYPLHNRYVQNTDNLRKKDHNGNQKRITLLLPFFGSTDLVGLGLFIELSRSHSDTTNSVGLLWTSDQADAETTT